MQLATVPDERRDAHQSRIVRRGASPHKTMSQDPAINGMRAPDLGQLLARFFQAQLISQGFGLVALHDLK